jgi:molybdopterin-guanine dinucleotide biosynthesis protein
MNISSPPTITGVILAGGQARRMGGEDKGLILFKDKPLISYVIATLKTQVDTLVINANRSIEQYQTFKYPVISDTLGDFCGPLAGMLSVMQTVDSDYILTVPCDSPHISPQLRQRMMEALLIQRADLAVAHTDGRLQPVFCLIPCQLKDDLEKYLQQGGRKIDTWLANHNMAVVDFSDQPNSFININHPVDLIAQQTPVSSPVPLIGFAAFSGTGKTTLLRQLIPMLKMKGLKVGVIKHAHHNFDIDVPGKDSYEIRKAGAQQVLVASSRLMALMEVQSDELVDPRLSTLISRLDCNKLDLILVEGFKHEAMPKIELYRADLEKPFLYPSDQNIVAIASDQPVDLERDIEQLDINNVDAIASYLIHFTERWTH